MKISNVRVYGLEESIYASGYPMLTTAPDGKRFCDEVSKIWGQVYSHRTGMGIKYNDLGKPLEELNRHAARASKLANTPAGSGHANFLKGIIVQLDVKAPQYFWQQFQRYNFVDFVSSMSKMHRISNIDVAETVNEKVSIAAIDNIKAYVNDYKNREVDIDTVLSNVPMGLEMTARMSTNYLQLKTIYKQRKNHRSEQWAEFCKWIESLPLAQMLIIND